MEATYNITVTEPELGAILQALSDRPYKQVNMMIIKLTQQFQEQRAAAQPPAEPPLEVVSDVKKGKRKGGQ